MSTNTKTNTSFNDFSSKDYLNEYHSKLDPESQKVLEFLSDSYSHIFTHLYNARLLEFGGGPTIYQLISAAKHPVTIDFCEYLPRNLDEVSLWLKNDPESFDWSPWVDYVLRYETGKSDSNAIKNREQILRSKILSLFQCDARQVNPLIDRYSKYDIVSIQFVAESITSSLQEWQEIMERLLSLVNESGYLIMSCITECHLYKVGNKFFPSVNISHTDIANKIASQGFELIIERDVSADHAEEQGYQSIAMFLGKKLT